MAGNGLVPAPPGPDDRFAIDEGEGPPVVLVHGQPGIADDWLPVVEQLSGSGLRVLAYDRPGWGGNPDPAVGLAGNAEWLDNALGEVVGDERVIVVGHSFGGGIATMLALAHPARVRSLVLVASVGSEAALSAMDRVLARPAMGEGVVRGGLFAARKVGTLVRPRLERSRRYGEAAGRMEKVALLRALTGQEPISERSWRSFLVEQRALVDETPGLQSSLSSLSVPTVVIAGTKDRVVPPAAARALAASIPGAELVLVEGAGHLLPVGQPGLVARTIERYVLLTG